MRLRELAVVAVVAAVAAAAALTVPPREGGAASSRSPSRLVEAAGWSGLAGGKRAPVAAGQRVLVVLSALSLADRVARAGGLASDGDERRWTAAAVAAQQQFISDLARKGLRIRPEFRFTRTLNGFSALLDGRAIGLLERTPGVKAVYPVRAAFPASVSSTVLRSAAFAPGSGRRPGVGIAGIAGHGVTVALLDTGVDLHKPFLHGHVLAGIDVLGAGPDARAHAKPTDPGQIEHHGTEMAGLLVGSGGPGGLAGVAPAATILPIRVAGWQADTRGGYTVYARTDAVLAGLERAVDPNGDGDAHDAARIALVPLAEPFAAFGDGPLARAAQGALRLDTLVVTAAGNDGPAGPAFGSVGAPGGAPAALTVGAADVRRVTRRTRLVVRSGLSMLVDREVPLLGAVEPPRTLELSPVTIRRAVTSIQDFFHHGLSVVAGRAAVLRAGADPAAVARWAAEAGAKAVLLHGRVIAPGGIGLDEAIGVPVLAVSGAAARDLAAHPGALVTIRAAGTSPVRPAGLAPFSSWGLAFDGGVKPELLAPGVGLVTSEPGAAPGGGPAFGTVNGSSAAAAVVAGAAALLAEARPNADAARLRSLLIGGSTPVAGAPVTGQGTGMLDIGRAATSEIVVDPATITFGRGARDGWQGDRELRLRNVSTRRLTVFVSSGQGRNARVPLLLSPRRVEIEPGDVARVTVRTRPITVVKGGAAAGALTVTPLSGAAVRVPWAVVLSPPRALVGPLSLSEKAFRPSERKPAVVTLRAGRVLRSAAGNEIVPVLRLDIELWTAKGKRLGLLTRLRDLLPGTYAFGLTGRGPGGRLLHRGSYRLRVYAWPTGGGPPESRSILFAIR